MTERRIRVGLIGTGRIAGFVHLPSLRLLPELCEVTAVASRDAHKAKAFAEQWGVPRVHDTWEALVGDPELDAVVVCPPSDLNGLVAGAAVAAGKHVLCEKPLAIAYPEARALAAAADRDSGPDPHGRIHLPVRGRAEVPQASRGRGALRRDPPLAHVLFQRRPARSAASVRLAPSAGTRRRGCDRRHGIAHDRRGALPPRGCRRGQRREPHLRRRAPDPGRRPRPSGDPRGLGVGGRVSQRRHRDVRREPRGGRAGRNRPAPVPGRRDPRHRRRGALRADASLPAADMPRAGDGPPPALGDRGGPPDLAVYPGSPRNPRADDPLLGYKYDQGVAFVRAVLGETTDYPTFRDGAAVQAVVDAVDVSARERRWIEVAP